MTSTYLIDGIGDEVTVFISVLFAVFIVVVSWLSTRVNDTNASTERLAAQPATVPNENQNQGFTSQPNNEENVASEEATPSNPESDRNDTIANSISPAIDASILRQRFVQSEQVSSEETVDNSTHASGSSSSSAPQPSINTLTLRLKYMDETIRTIEVNPDETLEVFMRQHFPADTRSRYKLIYRGQVLRDRTRTLRQLNLFTETNAENQNIPVIHCFLSPATPASNAGANMANSATQQMQLVAEDLHIGSLLLPILGLALICLWYLCIFHTSLFSIQSIVSIVGFTFLYVALIVNHII